ncbi:UNVERIFIED_CONTAM: hypothetical protein FKN15_045187 [Acipenser sinensis]
MASNLWSEDQFSCSVCLELLKDPVAIPCGHSYCMGCIKNCWDQTDHTGVYRCPQCRETFTPRPVLGRNTMLAEVVEKLKKTGLNPHPARSYAGPGDVPCDFCTGRKFKAVKSCLTCLASYCETHIKSHYEGAAFKRHKLINAIGDPEQKLCAEHQRLCEVFCRTDQTCICWLCTDEDHKCHETVSAEKERTEKQRSACIEIKESEKIFTELIRSIEKIHTEVIELIGANEKAAVNQAEGRMKKLEEEIAELINRNAELKQLSETEDHIHFLQNFQPLCAPPEAGDLPSVTVNTDISFGAVRKAVSKLKDHIEDFCTGELVKITKTGWCEIDYFGRDFSNRPWLEEGQDLQDINNDLLQIVDYMNIAAGRREAAGKNEKGGGEQDLEEQHSRGTGPGGAAQPRNRTWRSSTAEEQDLEEQHSRGTGPGGAAQPRNRTWRSSTAEEQDLEEQHSRGTGPGGAAQPRNRTWRSSTAEEQDLEEQHSRGTGPGGAAQLRNRSSALKRRGKCPLHSDLQTTVLIKRASTRTP